MASRTQWTWVWVSSGSWWWTGRPGVLQSVGSQRIRHAWATELNLTRCLVWRISFNKGIFRFCMVVIPYFLRNPDWTFFFFFSVFQNLLDVPSFGKLPLLPVLSWAASAESRLPGHRGETGNTKETLGYPYCPRNWNLAWRHTEIGGKLRTECSKELLYQFISLRCSELPVSWAGHLLDNLSQNYWICFSVFLFSFSHSLSPSPVSLFLSPSITLFFFFSFLVSFSFYLG